MAALRHCPASMHAWWRGSMHALRICFGGICGCSVSLPSEHACMVEGFDACTTEWFDPWCTAGQCGSLNLRCGSIHSPLFTLTGQRGSNRGASIRTPCRLSYDTSLLLAMGGVCITSGESLAKVTPLGATLLGGTDLMTALPSLRREVLWVKNMLRS